MAFSLLCISIFTFENLFGTMGWYCTIVTGQLFPCKNRLRNQGISCSWWCLWFSCGVAGTSTSQFFTTISGRVLFRMNGLGGRGCLEEAWIKCHCPKWAVLLNPAFRVSSRMVRHYITPWWCSSVGQLGSWAGQKEASIKGNLSQVVKVLRYFNCLVNTNVLSGTLDSNKFAKNLN